RLLLITAQRNSEVCGLRLSELDIEQRVWSLPIERTKKSQHHMLPLPDTAISIISEAMRTTADNTFLFASNSKEGHLTCGALDHAMVRIFQTWETDYTPHDLRRTATTGMAALGVSRFITNKIRNKVDRSVAAIYDRHKYLDEMRAAMDTWSNQLHEITTCKAGSSRQQSSF